MSFRKKDHPQKGEYDKCCNRPSCQSTGGVIWYNHKDQKYYCGTCAALINFNNLEYRLYNDHDLCTIRKK